jgi:hypothetical protein
MLVWVAGEVDVYCVAGQAKNEPLSGTQVSLVEISPRRILEILWRPMKLQPSLSPFYLSEVSCDEPAAATSV